MFSRAPTGESDSEHVQAPPQLLVVDDSASALTTVAAIVEPLGADLVTATSGEDALRYLLNDPDVAAIMLDVGLPGMDGYDVAREIRQSLPNGATKLIAVTGYGQPSDRELARQAGFDMHLLKPISPEVLQRLLVE